MARDIVDALMRISHEFQMLGLKVPEAILLKDHEQGIRLLGQLHQMHFMVIPAGSERAGKVIEHPDGSVWMQAEVYGMKIKWPAMKLAQPEGGYVWT